MSEMEQEALQDFAVSDIDGHAPRVINVTNVNPNLPTVDNRKVAIHFALLVALVGFAMFGWILGILMVLVFR